MRFQLVIPVLNEEVRLAGSVERVCRFLVQRCCWPAEVVIADNGSRDGTWAIASRLAADHANVRAVHIDQCGRGRALKEVWKASDAEVLSYMDVDLSTDLQAFPPLIESLTSGRWDLAIGSRLLPQSRVRRSWRRELISRSYNYLLKVALHMHVSDAQCGFKALTRDSARQLLAKVQDNHWFFDSELLFYAERFGLRVFEQPVHWVEDADSRVRILPTMLEDLRGVVRLRRELGVDKRLGKPPEQSVRSQSAR